MKTCTHCKGTMHALTDKTPEGIAYQYFKCSNCSEEILNRTQLHAVAQKYRQIKNYHVKVSTWGLSLGVRIPKELAKKYKLRDDQELLMLPEEDGIRMVV